MVVIGGRGTFIGPIIGAVLLATLPELLGRFAEYKLLIYGMLLVIAVTLVPDGLAGLWQARRVTR
jgi:branched-chain amino acid transport system permease protein